MTSKADKIHPFEIHKQGCQKCGCVDFEHTSTFVNCCAEGSRMLLDFVSVIASKKAKAEQARLKREFSKEADGKIYKTTKEKAKLATKYK